MSMTATSRATLCWTRCDSEIVAARRRTVLEDGEKMQLTLWRLQNQRTVTVGHPRLEGPIIRTSV